MGIEKKIIRFTIKNKFFICIIIVMLFLSYIIINLNQNMDAIEAELNANIVDENNHITDYQFYGTVSLVRKDPHILIEIQGAKLYKKNLKILFHVDSSSTSNKFTTNEIDKIYLEPHPGKKIELTRDKDFIIDKDNYLIIPFNQEDIFDSEYVNCYIYINKKGNYTYTPFKDLKIKIISKDIDFIVLFDHSFQVSNYNKGDLDVIQHGLRVEGNNELDYYTVLLHYYPDAFIIISIFIGFLTLISLMIGFNNKKESKEDVYDNTQNLK